MTNEYVMRIDLNVLNHLGINLYSNTPAVISEAIANAWDAGATEVRINIDKEQQRVMICDNGCGMTFNDINKKFLIIGYPKRDADPVPTNGRKMMGRKGIGKLSLFSIADKIYVHSKKDGETNAFVMDALKIKEIIENKSNNPYKPESVDFDDNALAKYETGTFIVLQELKKNISRTSVALKKRLARRFTIIGTEEFRVFLNDEEIKYSDREYYDKARFLFQYGENKFLGQFSNLDVDKDTGKKIIIDCPNYFDDAGNSNADGTGKYHISGWIGVARHSNDLDAKVDDESDDNLNNIAIVVRGKIAQQDILSEFRKGGLITKFLYGEIEADFLDNDEEQDIATSSRQKIMEDEIRYKALKNFINKELDYIWREADKLKEKKGIENAMNIHPKIREWYNALRGDKKKSAVKLFGKIEKIAIDEKHRKTLCKYGILAFEQLQHKEKLSELDKLPEDKLDDVIKLFSEIDDIEAIFYYEITHGRLRVIQKLISLTIEDDVIERVIQEFIYHHLWLLDPSWDRATEIPTMEKTVAAAFEKISKKLSDEEKQGRVDIRYKKCAGKHIIIELKKNSVNIKVGEITDQVKKYKSALEKQISDNGESGEVEVICLVGELPKGWVDADKNALSMWNIRLLTYSQLINDAEKMYGEYLKIGKDKMGRLREIIEFLDKDTE